ncbi:hypothetical protein [Methanobrevibacter arboriphilus]|uniref:hypothetical protein n=1 Tax=Methanobrevibacter arboriphilus TaxID=39441 RepID=UPI0006D0063E|nr:hypothetical protein [Methanobrevibacter arboriphilus]
MLSTGSQCITKYKINKLLIINLIKIMRIMKIIMKLMKIIRKLMKIIIKLMRIIIRELIKIMKIIILMKMT